MLSQSLIDNTRTERARERFGKHRVYREQPTKPFLSTKTIKSYDICSTHVNTEKFHQAPPERGKNPVKQMSFIKPRRP